MIDYDATIEAIEEVLNNICNIFPDSLTNMCENFLDKHYEQLLDEFTQKHDTEIACYNMGACE